MCFPQPKKRKKSLSCFAFIDWPAAKKKTDSSHVEMHFCFSYSGSIIIIWQPALQRTPSDHRMSFIKEEIVCLCLVLIERWNERQAKDKAGRAVGHSSLCWQWTAWQPWHVTPVCFFIFFFPSRKVPGRRTKRSKHVKAATRASISPSANTTASPVERWAQMEQGKLWALCRNGGMKRERSGRFLLRKLLAASQRSFSVLLQAICAKCSKTLDNKTSRLCPECFEASLSLESLGVGEQKRKAAPEVRHTHTYTELETNKNHEQTHTHRHREKDWTACAWQFIFLLRSVPVRWNPSHHVTPLLGVDQGSAARLRRWQQKENIAV